MRTESGASRQRGNGVEGERCMKKKEKTQEKRKNENLKLLIRETLKCKANPGRLASVGLRFRKKKRRKLARFRTTLLYRRIKNTLMSSEASGERYNFLEGLGRDRWLQLLPQKKCIRS